MKTRAFQESSCMTDHPDTPLPDVFKLGGPRAVSVEDWRRLRQAWQDVILDIQYGRLPPAPGFTRGVELHSHPVERLGGARHTQYRLITGPDRRFEFLLDLLSPPGPGPFPAVISGDACWRYVADDIALDVIGRGCHLAQFNRVEIVPDTPGDQRAAGLYLVHPEGDYGALAAWAWGYHRCVDFLATLPFVDAARIAVVGHSRGGKAALLAGATDERIALTAPNNSGCGGAGCYRRQGPDSETLSDIVSRFPYWFSPRFKERAGREAELPFDQHCLKALVAPRALLSTEALGDLWANPSGTWQTHRAAREVYRFLGTPDRIGFWFRAGGHSHGREDWAALLDFADWQWAGKPPARRFDADPFPGLPPAHRWSAP
jgi:hypothetical protein